MLFYTSETLIHLQSEFSNHNAFHVFGYQATANKLVQTHPLETDLITFIKTCKLYEYSRSSYCPSKKELRSSFVWYFFFSFLHFSGR